MTNYDFSGTSPVTNPIYLVSALILVVVSTWIVHRLDKAHEVWGLAIMLHLALMVYPATLDHYTVLLIVPMLLLWRQRADLPFGTLGVAALIVLEYVMVAHTSTVFLAILLNWMVLVGFCSTLFMQQSVVRPQVLVQNP